MSRISSIGAALVILTIPSMALAQTVSRPYLRDVASELACGPQAALVPPAATLRIAGSHEPKRTLFAMGDQVTIDAGTALGVTPGNVYFVRRAVADRFAVPTADGLLRTSIHTAGWIRILDAQPETAVAIITHACDGVETGDYLEPFVLPIVPTVAPAGVPDYSAPGHIILGDDRRQTGAAGSLMVLDIGRDRGLTAGQRLTIFRDTMGGRAAGAHIGEATAVVVHAETALVRIESSRDAVSVGDLVAIQR